MTRYSRAHYRLVSPAADTKAEIAARLIDNKARECGRLDLAAQYPVISYENFHEACKYQESRIVFHRERLTKESL